MQLLGFGPKEKRTNRRGEVVEVSKYGIHTQCKWRLVDSERIVTGSGDLYRPADESIPEEEFDWDKDDSVLDFKMMKWLAEYEEAPPLVVEARGDAYGGFCITLDNGQSFVTFPCESHWSDEEEEIWRLLGHRKDGRHFVVSDCGVELEGKVQP